ncbi:MAG: hypothetical protein HW421_3643 [Ignavibacteria bacterium]|nr:hypothetical protein [Ignavibacteria bacterium]
MEPKINIGVPDNPVYSALHDRAKDYCAEHNINLIKLPESKIAEYMLNSRLDAALLSPYGYGMAVGKADYRIIPTYCLALQDFTSEASIYFNAGLKNILSCVSPEPDDFIIVIGKILLAERYGIVLNIGKVQGSPEELLKVADAAICWTGSAHEDNALDISEEWFATYETPLPLAFWVVRADEEPENIEEIINSLCEENLPDSIDVFDSGILHRNQFDRSGKIIYRYDGLVHEALEGTLELLYYQQLLPEIPEVKIFRKDIGIEASPIEGL